MQHFVTQSVQMHRAVAIVRPRPWWCDTTSSYGILPTSWVSKAITMFAVQHLVLVLCVVNVSAKTTPRPWFDQTLPRSQRVASLLAQLNAEEKIAQLVVDTPKIARLGVPAYHWRNNILHGTVDNGVSTQFPQAIGMAASWDIDLLHDAARVMADEQRAKHNIAVNNTGGDSPMDYGLDLWGKGEDGDEGEGRCEDMHEDRCGDDVGHECAGICLFLWFNPAV